MLIPSATLAGAAAPSLPRGQLLPGAPGPAGLRLQPEQLQSQASSSGCFPFEQQQADPLMTSLPLQPPVQPRRQPALTTSSPSELTWEQWRASLPDNGPMTEYRHGVHHCCLCDGSIRGDFEAHVGSKKPGKTLLVLENSWKLPECCVAHLSVGCVHSTSCGGTALAVAGGAVVAWATHVTDVSCLSYNFVQTRCRGAVSTSDVTDVRFLP